MSRETKILIVTVGAAVIAGMFVQGCVCIYPSERPTIRTGPQGTRIYADPVEKGGG